MKVNIGPHRRWVGLYQIVDTLQYAGLSEDRTYAIAAAIDSKLPWIQRFLQWFHDHVQPDRRIKVHVDQYDVWNADHTLALVILPVLKRLQQVKHGSPHVNMEDVPEELRCDLPSEENNYHDATIHERWDWVLSEMIWAFEQIVEEDAEMKFWEEVPELDLSDHPEDEGKEFIPVRWKKAGVCNRKARDEWRERIDRGLLLFGKYYHGLWD